MPVRVGRANAGVPRKTTRMRRTKPRLRQGACTPWQFSFEQMSCPSAVSGPLGCCFSLCLLLEFAHDHVAFEPRQEVDDQLAVEVIDLVLDGGREQALRGELLPLALPIEELNAHGRWPLDLDAHVWDR